ncbi:putative monooxygenase [Actinorhabdospora filicis]|uniref:Monooxygenase n=1 Tax=Actinorhabdospora filicis TaxID=1785913 RepID=A0A9W6ST34_9ACTN|nr:LLM class flavin-dependent oxidoreductase [Actinorhabdospora filicis]GLZ81568.1 putative monooxygenase [Actinorhabdospora filicis]
MPPPPLSSPHPIPLSILDLAPVAEGGTPAGALRNALDLARHAERLGYRRFWVAEHHLAPGVASAAPAVLIALIVAATTRIRVGSGAVLLGNQRPLQVAEQFGTIAQLHPGRVDLGLGRSGGRPSPPAENAPETPAGTGGLLQPAPFVFGTAAARFRLAARLLGTDPDADYATAVADILSFFAGTHRAPESGEVHAIPAEGADPEVWILGSSPGESARTAGKLGLPFVVNYHSAPARTLDTVAAYRDAFRPGRLAAPHVMASADVLVADDDATAEHHAAGFGDWVLAIRDGRGAIPYPSPESAARARWTDDERALVADRLATRFTGSPSRVAERLRALAGATGADELIVTTIAHDHRARLRSFELLAEAWT